MKTNKGQRDSIESGRGMVYVTEGGRELYIERVKDVYGEPSKAYPGCFYVFDGDGMLMFDGRMFTSLGDAQAACEAGSADGRHVSATQAAEMLGVSRMRVNQLIREGKLEAEKVGNAYAVDRASVERRMEPRKPFEMHELEAFLGGFADDFDIDAIIDESTEIDYRTGNRYWREGIDLNDVCARHDTTAE